MNRDRVPLRVALGAVMSAIIVATSLGVSASAWLGTGELIEELAEDVFARVFAQVHGVTEGHLRASTHLLAMQAHLVESGVVHPEDRDAMSDHMLRVLETHPLYTHAAWGDRDGFAVWSYRRTDGGLELHRHDPLPEGGTHNRIMERDGEGGWRVTSEIAQTDYDPRIRPWYTDAIASERSVWTEPYVFLPQELPGVTHGLRALDADGAVWGVVTLDFELEFLSETLATLDIVRGGQIFVFTSAGALIAHSTPELSVDRSGDAVEVAIAAESADPLTRRAAEIAADRDEGAFTLDGEPFLVVARDFQAVPGQAWRIALVIPERFVMGHVRENERRTGLAALFFLGLALLAALVFSRRVTSGLRSLARELDRVERFELAPRELRGSRIREIHKLETTTERMKTGLRSFQRYVPSDLVRGLLDSGVEARIGGDHRELTLYFADVAGFTGLAERVSPDALAKFLGDYLGETSALIAQTGGTIDKFMGDGVMAFWGAPEPVEDHAVQACLSALATQAAAARMAGPDGAPVRVRVGLHTGTALVGNFGAPERLNYTAMGDAVNLAARLEGANKGYGTDVLISESTWALVSDRFEARRLDRIAVKGRAEGVVVYELLAEKGALDPSRAALRDRYERALARYFARDWTAARAGFAACLAMDPDDRASARLRERVEHYLDAPPPDDWGGVYTLTEK